MVAVFWEVTCTALSSTWCPNQQQLKSLTTPTNRRKAELELELIKTRMIQKPLLWLEVGKSACVLVGICGLRLSPPSACSICDMTRNAPRLWTFSRWVSGPRSMDLSGQIRHGALNIPLSDQNGSHDRPIATRVRSCGLIVDLFPGLCSSVVQPVYWDLP
jgi:hypothetical protein